jgi:hypothetical protein
VNRSSPSFLSAWVSIVGYRCRRKTEVLFQSCFDDGVPILVGALADGVDQGGFDWQGRNIEVQLRWDSFSCSVMDRITIRCCSAALCHKLNSPSNFQCVQHSVELLPVASVVDACHTRELVDPLGTGHPPLISPGQASPL